jgi:RNA polymerase sigma factor (sigma-70 family)
MLAMYTTALSTTSTWPPEGDSVEPAQDVQALPPAPAAQAAQPWVPPTWQEVVEQHSARVYRLAYRLTGNRYDAEDLTQEVFVRVFRSLSTYTPGTFEGWLHRITTNLFLDQVRRKKRIRFDALPEDSDARLPGREPDPSRAYDDTHLDDDVQAALDALSPDFRAAVVLCDIEELSYEEIAATLGIKLGTVRSRIHRGRSQLRDALAHRAPRRSVNLPRRRRSSARAPRRLPGVQCAGRDRTVAEAAPGGPAAAPDLGRTDGAPAGDG